MKVAMIISEQQSTQQLQESYLLCLALLNFEHQLNVVFIGQAVALLDQDAALKKSWLALKLYGAEAFYQLNKDSQNKSEPATNEHCQLIDSATFAALKNDMDLLL